MLIYTIAIAAWLVGVIVSLINCNRRLPITVFLLGSLVIASDLVIGFGFITTSAIALLAVSIWIANKIDMA